MAEGIFFIAAMMMLLLLNHLCNSLLLQPPHYHHHHRPIQTQIFSVDPITATTDRDDILPSQQSIKRKRRRRKADSFFLTQSTDEPSATSIESSTNYSLVEEEEEIVAEKQQSECPFAMTFPRYRVNINSYNKAESEKRRSRRVQRGVIKKLVNNLSAKRKNVDEDNGKNNEGIKPWGIVSNIVQGVFSDTVDTKSNMISRNSDRVRNSVESIYETEVKEGLFLMVQQASPLADEDFVAAAVFWRMVSDIAEQLLTQSLQGKKWYLALPETTTEVASNLCEILNWYADQQVDSDSVQIRAQLDSRSTDVPVIQFIANGNYQQQQPQLSDSLPSAEDAERHTKAWVTRLLVKLGVCPFTKSPEKSGQGLSDMGVPVANIMYCHSDALSHGSCGVYLLMADAWQAINTMVAAGPAGKAGVSSILLSAPGFDNDFAIWAGPVFAMLEAGVSAIQAEEVIGVVCFHPQYVIPDGKSWPGFGHMHSLPRLKNWYNQYRSDDDDEPATSLDDNEIAAGGAFQRRTPHAVINVLRAEQLEAAEGRRSTGELYERNIRVLMGREGIGLEKLTEDLRLEQQR